MHDGDQYEIRHEIQSPPPGSILTSTALRVSTLIISNVRSCLLAMLAASMFRHVNRTRLGPPIRGRYAAGQDANATWRPIVSSDRHKLRRVPAGPAAAPARTVRPAANRPERRPAACPQRQHHCARLHHGGHHHPLVREVRRRLAALGTSRHRGRQQRPVRCRQQAHRLARRSDSRPAVPRTFHWSVCRRRQLQGLAPPQWRKGQQYRQRAAPAPRCRLACWLHSGELARFARLPRSTCSPHSVRSRRSGFAAACSAAASPTQLRPASMTCHCRCCPLNLLARRLAAAVAAAVAAWRWAAQRKAAAVEAPPSVGLPRTTVQGLQVQAGRLREAANQAAAPD